MVKSDIYYFMGKLPKGKRRPTMEEAIRKNKVGYYGLHPVDEKLVDDIELEKYEYNREQRKIKRELKKNPLYVHHSMQQSKQQKLDAAFKKSMIDESERLRTKKEKLMIAYAGMGGQLKKIRKNIDEEVYQKKIDALNKEYNELKEKKNKLSEQIDAIKEKEKKYKIFL